MISTSQMNIYFSFEYSIKSAKIRYRCSDRDNFCIIISSPFIPSQSHHTITRFLELIFFIFMKFVVLITIRSASWTHFFVLSEWEQVINIHSRLNIFNLKPQYSYNAYQNALNSRLNICNVNSTGHMRG